MKISKEELETLVIQYQNNEIEFDVLFNKAESLIGG